MSEPQVRRISAPEHGLTTDRVSPAALDVTEKLNAAGYEGLLVGGCVRDLLLGLTPKDFDVATNATPEEVRDLFRRSRLVGRRFRIAHVRYGRELIEVSTFRRATAEEADERAHSDAGMILRDNVFGSLEEDAFRRDFTINALYYDPLSEEILDYVGGLDDLESGQLRFIGDAATRVREDPVRALRAVRFQAKLNCELDQEISDCLGEAAELMAAVPPARLFDEIQKVLMSGQAERAWTALVDTPLRAALFPSCNPDDALVPRAMRNTDDRLAADKPVTPGFLLAVLLWADYRARVLDLSEDLAPVEARLHGAADCLAEQQQIMAVPRRFSQFIREVWQLQDRLETRIPMAIERIAGHARFRAAYDFLVLRAETGDSALTGEETDLAEAADWWTRYQEVEGETRSAMREERRGSAPKRKRRRRRSRRRRSDAASSENPSN
ncbi:MAG: polynucleotide adenylyltransferase PcnB [Pseudomonadota bacterium]